MEYIKELKAQLAKKGATLVTIWVQTDPEIVHERMITRASDHDDWKLEHWDEYIASCNFEIPEDLHDPNVKDDLLIFNNNNDEEFKSETPGKMLLMGRGAFYPGIFYFTGNCFPAK